MVVAYLEVATSGEGTFLVDQRSWYFGQEWNNPNFIRPQTKPQNLIYEIAYDSKYDQTFVTITNDVQLGFSSNRVFLEIEGVYHLLNFDHYYDDGISPHRRYAVSGDPWSLKDKIGNKINFRIWWN